MLKVLHHLVHLIHNNMRNFTQEEAKVIYKDAKSKGLDPDKVMSQLVLKGATIEGIDMNQARQYAQSKQPKPEADTSIIGRVKETIGDVTGIVKDIKESSQKRADNILESENAMNRGEQGVLRTAGQELGQFAGAGADAIGAVFKGAGNIFLSDKHEKDVSDVIGKFGAKVMAVPEVQSIINTYNELPEEKQRDIDALGGVLSLVSNFIGGQAVGQGANVAKRGVTTGTEAVVTGAKNIAEDVAESTIVTGAKQIGSDLVKRIPRTIERAKTGIAEQSVRATKIKNATPALKKAYESNLDEVIIDNIVNSTDDITKKAYSDVLDIAEMPKTIGKGKQPSIVGGELATKQYDVINKQKQSIGKKIGDITKSLSKTEKIDIKDSFIEMDDVLSNNGIIPRYTKKGVKLDFSNSKFTPAERTKIQQLYDLTREGGDVISPSKIKDKDQLFSKLKRESNLEQIGDILVDTTDGQKSLFSVFRDVFSKKLDTISPEVKTLNNQYRKISQVTEDIEDAIFRTPNYNVTKSVDPAEFAKVNMRRIFGESQSSPVFEAIADNMDILSRELGYAGATPKQVAEFAEYIRKLYPETIPKTGFQGGIKAGVSDIIETISKTGTPNLADQRKALRELLRESAKKKK